MTQNHLGNRFKIIFASIIVAFGLTYLIFKSHELYFLINFIIAFAVWAWLIFDYEILQIDAFYFSLLGLGLAIFFYGQMLYNTFPNEAHNSLILSGTALPLTLLIIQRLLRIVFKKIMKREPIVEKPAPSGADFLYSFVLFVTTLMTAFLL